MRDSIGASMAVMPWLIGLAVVFFVLGLIVVALGAWIMASQVDGPGDAEHDQQESPQV